MHVSLQSNIRWSAAQECVRDESAFTVMRSRLEELWAAIVVHRSSSDSRSHPCGPRVHEYLNRKGTSSKHQSKPYLFNYWPQIWDLQPNSSFWWEAKSARSNACLYSNHVDNMSIKDRPSTAGRPSWTEKKTGYFLVTLHLNGIHKKFFVCWKGIRKQQRNYSKEILLSISLENKRVPGMKKKITQFSIFS